MNNVLTVKFETPPGNRVGLTSAFVGGFGLWGAIGMVGGLFYLGVGAESVPAVVFHVEL